MADETSDAPQPAVDTNPAWSPAGLEAAVDRALNTNQPTAGADAQEQNPPGTAGAGEPGTATTPGSARSATAAEPSEAAQPAAATPPTGDEAARHREVYQQVEQMGGPEELGILQRIAAPLVAPEIDPAGFFRALEEQRGSDAFSDVAWAMYDLHADAFIADALANPDQIGGDLAGIADPMRRAEITALRQEVADFNAWRAAGRPAATSVTMPTAAPYRMPALPANGTVTAASLPEIPPEDLNLLPDSMRAFVSAAQAQASLLPELQNQVRELQGFRETETQRRERETREAETRARQQEEQTAASRESKLYGELDSALDRLVEKLAFSVNPDATARAEEDKQIREDIKARVSAAFLSDTQRVPEIKKLWGNTLKAYVRGDFVGPRAAVRALLAHVQTLGGPHIQRHGGRLTAAVQADAAVANQNNQPGRTTVSGPGSGGAPAGGPAPAADTSNSWDTNAMSRRFDQLSQQRRR